MGWFSTLLRRPRGRHAVGATVTSIPSARLQLVAPAAAVPAPTVPAPTASAPAVPTPTAPAATVPAPAVPAPTLPAATVPAPAAAAPVRSPAPTLATLPSVPVSRVQLGFRDGSTASLAAGSEQAVALEALAGLLNRRSS